MNLPVYHIDAFTNEVFGGNPAGVMPLSYWLPDEILLQLAAENALPETAFFVDRGDYYDLRWFTPDIEMDLCGHATLATAHVLANHLGKGVGPFHFETRSGRLTVTLEADWYTLDLPSRPPRPAILPAGFIDAFGHKPLEIMRDRDYVLLFESAAQIRTLSPDRAALDRHNLGPGGIICTAPGGVSTGVDFVSRFFTPQSTIFEDPVTGSAHCTTVPFWAERLGKRVLTARQLSARGGYLRCELRDERVLLGGQAVTYSEGVVRLPS